MVHEIPAEWLPVRCETNTVNAILRHDYPLAVEPGITPRPLVQKKTWRDSLPIDMLLSALSVLVVAQSSSEIPEGLMNIPVLIAFSLRQWLHERAPILRYTYVACRVILHDHLRVSLPSGLLPRLFRVCYVPFPSHSPCLVTEYLVKDTNYGVRYSLQIAEVSSYVISGPFERTPPAQARPVLT